MKTYHVCLDIDGGIRHADTLIGCIKVNGYPLVRVDEIRRYLNYQKDLGRKVLPCGDCDNFDYQTGCRGHIVDDEGAM